MKEFIKEVFNLRNLKKAVLLAGVITDQNLASEDYLNLVKYISEERNISNRKNDSHQETELKKAS